MRTIGSAWACLGLIVLVGCASSEAAPPPTASAVKPAPAAKPAAAVKPAAPAKAAGVPASTVATKAAPAKPASPTPQTITAPKHPVDILLAKENSGRGTTLTPVIDDLAFLRRISVDLISRIPTEEEIQAYQKLPAAARRSQTIDRLMADARFTDRFTVFFADMLRIRSNADGGGAFLAYVHKSVGENKPYDVMVRELLSAQGRAGKVPEIGYVLGDNADPMALAGVTSQVFLGIRISCAECHDHPFDVWKREQFYGFAAYFGRTRRVESELTKAVYTIEEQKSSVLWPPQGEAEDKDRKPMPPKFPFTLDEKDGPRQHLARLTALRTKPKDVTPEGKPEANVDDLLAEAGSKVQKATTSKKPSEFDVDDQNRQDKKQVAETMSLIQGSESRMKLAEIITDPRNKAFARNFMNRLWADLIGRGMVEPIDDFSGGNPPSHPETLEYLAEEFIASGFDLKAAVKLIVMTDAYQRSPLYGVDEATRVAAEEAFSAGAVRRMQSEAMFDSIVLAGHLFDVKHPEGLNMKEDWQYQRVPLRREGQKSTPLAGIKGQGGQPAMEGEAMQGKGMAGPGGGTQVASAPYDLESSIEVDFSKSLAEQDEVEIEAMAKMSNEQIEAMEMARQAQMKYLDRYVRIIFDDNPKYGTSLRMASPASPQHFLRVFGQPSREALGEQRDTSSSMRQALMMLNGRLTHEASRVGSLEPIHALMVGKKPDLDGAIRLAYREILTREPSTDEIAEAKVIIGEGSTPLDGMADLRWLLFNCHEFRFLP